MSNLRFAPGEYAAIVGPSGSGKSTLMHLLGLLDRPSSGVISVGGRDATGLSDAELSDLRNETIGFVFQSFQLLTRTTALDNVALPLLYRGMRKSERREQAADALAAVGLGTRTDHRPSQLSGGEQQRVAIARALVGGPQLLLADEPTGNLDTKTGRDVMDILEQLNAERGVAVLLVTHDLDIAGRARRQVHMRDGQVESDSAAEALKSTSVRMPRGLSGSPGRAACQPAAQSAHHARCDHRRDGGGGPGRDRWRSQAGGRDAGRGFGLEHHLHFPGNASFGAAPSISRLELDDIDYVGRLIGNPDAVTTTLVER